MIIIMKLIFCLLYIALITYRVEGPPVSLFFSFPFQVAFSKLKMLIWFESILLSGTVPYVYVLTAHARFTESSCTRASRTKAIKEKGRGKRRQRSSVIESDKKRDRSEEKNSGLLQTGANLTELMAV